MSPVEDPVQVALRGGQLGPVVVVVPCRPLPVLHVDLVLVRAALRAGHSDVGADGDVVGVVPVDHEPAAKRDTMKGCKKEQVRQCLDFCTADFWSLLVYESAEQKPKHCLS